MLRKHFLRARNHRMLRISMSMKHPLHRQAGVALLEFAISATLFLMLLLGTIIWGLNIWEMNTLQYAVERGARCAILPVAPNGQKQCGTTASFAANNAPGLNHQGGPVSESNFLESTGTYGYTLTTSAYTASGSGTTTFDAACVLTQNVSFFGATTRLISVGEVAGTMRYCRPLQN
jgi:Flp pilus assembly protein TadG